MDDEGFIKRKEGEEEEGCGWFSHTHTDAFTLPSSPLSFTYPEHQRCYLFPLPHSLAHLMNFKALYFFLPLPPRPLSLSISLCVSVSEKEIINLKYFFTF